MDPFGSETLYFPSCSGRTLLGAAIAIEAKINAQNISFMPSLIYLIILPTVEDTGELGRTLTMVF